MPSWVEVCPIQLPGREDRYREPAFTSLVGIARAVVRELTPFLDKPFVLFGHSMGALLAFEVTRALRHAHARAPRALFLAAYPAPHRPLLHPAIHLLPDAEFVDEMRRMQGTPDAVLENAELMAFMLPILRADFEACDTYVCAPEPPLDCPFFLYGGDQDREVDEQGLEQWRQHTRGSFALQMLPGTHFFVQTQRERLLADVARRLEALPV